MYRTIDEFSVLRLADGARVPLVAGNTDYRDYLTWLSAGNTPEPAHEPEVIVPTVIGPAQLRLALRRLHPEITSSVVLDLISAMSEPNRSDAMDYWEYSTEIQREHPVLQALAHQLELTSSDVDDVFLLGATL